MSKIESSIIASIDTNKGGPDPSAHGALATARHSFGMAARVKLCFGVAPVAGGCTMELLKPGVAARGRIRHLSPLVVAACIGGYRMDKRYAHGNARRVPTMGGPWIAKNDPTRPHDT